MGHKGSTWVKRSMSKRLGWIPVTILTLLATPFIALAQTAFADVAPPPLVQEVVNDAQYNTERNEIATCLTYNQGSGLNVQQSNIYSAKGGILLSDISAWNWFNSGAKVADWTHPADGIDCGNLNGSTLTSYFKDLGFTQPAIATACAIGFVRGITDTNTGKTTQLDCLNGTGPNDNNSNEVFFYKTAAGASGSPITGQQALDYLNKVYKGGVLGNTYNNVQYYAMAYRVFFDQSACNTTLAGPMDTTPSSNTDGVVWIVDPTGKPVQYRYKLGGDPNKNWNFRQDVANNSNVISDTCDSQGAVQNPANLVHIMEMDYADYAAWIRMNPQYSKTTAPAITNTAGKASTPGSTATCTIAGVGWIICPVATLLGKVADEAVYILNTFFIVDSAKLFAPNSQTFLVWQQILKYADILFIITFMFIVFSQVTSFGISNYGIKKLLPKLLIVALLVNISYYVCALAVDVSNVLGVGLANLISTDLIKFQNFSPTSGFSHETAFGDIVSAVLITGVVGVTVSNLALATVVGIILSVVVVAVTMVIMLIIRQGLIILLVVLSPLAFAAMLLPNTEGLYKKWLKIFKTLLLIFPIASTLYGGGKLAGSILANSSAGTTQDPKSWLLNIMAAAMPILMLIALYSVFTGAMKGLEHVGGFMRGAAAGANKLSNPGNAMLAGLKKRDQDNRQILGNRLKRRFGGRFIAGAANREAHLGAQQAELEQMKQAHLLNNGRAQGYAVRQQTAKNLADAAQTSAGANTQAALLADTEGRTSIIAKAAADINSEISKTQVDTMTLGSASISRLDNAARAASMEKDLAQKTHDADWEETKATDPNLVTIDHQTRAEGARATNAQREASAGYAQELLANNGVNALVAQAGGNINPTAGQQRALQMARGEENRARTEAVANARIYFDAQADNNEANSIVNTGRRLNGAAASAEEMEAAAGHIFEKGSHEDKINAAMHSADATQYITDPEAAQRVRNVIADSYAKNAISDLAGKSYASKIRTGSTDADFRAAVVANSGAIQAETLVKNSVKYGKTLNEVYANVGPAEQKKMAASLEPVIRYIKTVETLKSDVATDGQKQIDIFSANAGYKGHPGW